MNHRHQQNQLFTLILGDLLVFLMAINTEGEEASWLTLSREIERGFTCREGSNMEIGGGCSGRLLQFFFPQKDHVQWGFRTRR